MGSEALEGGYQKLAIDMEGDSLAKEEPNEMCDLSKSYLSLSSHKPSEKATRISAEVKPFQFFS